MNFKPYQTVADCTDPLQKQIVEAIAKSGWALMSMLPTEPGGLPFTYTVGLEGSYEHPELVVIGVDFNAGARILNGVGALVKGGQRLAPSSVIPGGALEAPVDFTMGAVCDEARQELMHLAAWYYRGTDFRALQVIWPDTEGRFPGQEAFEFAQFQPLLKGVAS